MNVWKIDLRTQFGFSKLSLVSPSTSGLYTTIARYASRDRNTTGVSGSHYCGFRSITDVLRMVQEQISERYCPESDTWSVGIVPFRLLHMRGMYKLCPKRPVGRTDGLSRKSSRRHMCDARVAFLGRVNHGFPGCELGDLGNLVYRNRSEYIRFELC